MSRATNPFSMIRSDASKRNPLAPFDTVRSEMAEIARGKLRQARAGNFGDATLERLCDWAAAFVS